MTKTPKKSPGKFEKTPNKLEKTPKFEKTTKTPMKPVKTPKKSPAKFQNTPKQSPAKPAFTPKKTPGQKMKTPKVEISPKVEAVTPKVEVASPTNGKQNKKGKKEAKQNEFKHNEFKQNEFKQNEFKQNQKGKNKAKQNEFKQNQKAQKRKLNADTEDAESKPKKTKPENDHNDPQVQERTLFVGNIPLDTTEKDIRDLFKGYGKIQTVRFRGVPREDPKMNRKVALIKKKFHPKAKNMYCFVCFATKEMARKALAVDKQVYKTHHLRVNISAEKFEPKADQCIFVGNLSFDCGEDELRSVFADCGEIESVRIVKDRDTNISRGFGFVNFSTSDAVELALQMEDVQINKREIRIKRFGQKTDTLTQKSRSINVSNIPVKASRHSLYEAFKDCGKIINMTFIPTKQHNYSKACLITFETAVQADKALFKRTKIFNNALFVKKDKFEPATQIFLKNIPENTQQSAVKLALKDCGVIHSVKLCKGKGEHKNGYGIVAFTTKEEADKAINMQNITIADVTVQIDSYLSDSMEKFMEKKPEKKVKKAAKPVVKEESDEENANEDEDESDDDDKEDDDDDKEDDDSDDDDMEQEDDAGDDENKASGDDDSDDDDVQEEGSDDDDDDDDDDD